MFNYETFNYETFNYETFNYEMFNYEMFNYETFNYETFNYETFNYEMFNSDDSWDSYKSEGQADCCSAIQLCSERRPWRFMSLSSQILLFCVGRS